MAPLSLLPVATLGRRQLIGGGPLARHCHRTAYVALVLSGGYVEAGIGSRRFVRAGDFLIHHPFESHFNQIATSGAQVLNLPLPVGRSLAEAGRCTDPDLVARVAEKDSAAAVLAIADNIAEPPPPLLQDWPDLLARELVGGHIRSLARWAHAFGLAPGTVSRGFRQTYGVSPKRYRAEARAHRAWTALKGNERLSQLALSQGFADQSHMTRAVTALTGFPPSHWRGGEK